jgi:hypothetical protein
MHKVERFPDWFNLYKISLGAIAYCLAKMMGILEDLGNQEAVEVAKKAKAKQERASDMKLQWEQQRDEDPLRSEDATKIDNKIDSTLSNILQIAEGFAEAEMETERKRVADEFVDDLFASGVYPITSKPFHDQHEAVNRLLDQIEDSYTEHVEKLNIGGLCTQLRELNEEFGQRLGSTQAERIDYDEVEAATVEAEDAFYNLIVKVMHDYADDLETFNRVVYPLREQLEWTRRHMKRRGTVPEIDPDSGEPVDENADGGSGGDGESGAQNDGGANDDPRNEGDPTDGDGEGDTSTPDDEQDSQETTDN